MDDRSAGNGDQTGALAVVLAAIGELEAELLVSKQKVRTPHADDVVKRLSQAGIEKDRAAVVETLKVAIAELGLATGVLAPGQDGQPDARSLHLTMAGVRWLRNEIRRSPPSSPALVTPAPEPPA